MAAKPGFWQAALIGLACFVSVAGSVGGLLLVVTNPGAAWGFGIGAGGAAAVFVAPIWDRWFTARHSAAEGGGAIRIGGGNDGVVNTGTGARIKQVAAGLPGGRAPRRPTRRRKALTGPQSESARIEVAGENSGVVNTAEDADIEQEH